MTNLEKIKQLSAKEFAEWFYGEENTKKPSLPIWCKNRHCGDVNGNCKVCFIKWLNKEVKMTNLEKWKKKLAEAKGGWDFSYQLKQMGHEMLEKHCRPARNCELECLDCRAKWFGKEAEE